MILNGVMAVILRHLAKAVAFEANYVKTNYIKTNEAGP